MRAKQLVLVGMIVGAGTVPIEGLGENGGMVRMTPPGARASNEHELPSLTNALGWINSGPLTADDLRGKVVLVEFWTYTCVNWLRTLPYVRAWAAKYKDLFTFG